MDVSHSKHGKYEEGGVLHIHRPFQSICKEKENMRVQKHHHQHHRLQEVTHTRAHQSQSSILMIFPFSLQLQGQWNGNKNCDRKRNFHRMQKCEARMLAAVNGLGGGKKAMKIIEFDMVFNDAVRIIIFFFSSFRCVAHTHNMEFITNVCKKEIVCDYTNGSVEMRVNETNKEKQSVQTWLE